MPRTNQGVFNKLSNEFKSLQIEYNQAIMQYFSSGEWNSNYDFFSDFTYTADSIYIKANSLSNDIGGMLNATKFESADKKNKYQDMLLSAQKMAEEIKNKFDDTLNLIKLSGGGLSDSEQRTVDKLNIYG